MQPYEVFDVQSPSDAGPSRLNRLKILPDGRLIVADTYNKCVKLFDTNHRLIDKVQLPGDLWDITVVGATQVLIIINIRADMRQMQFVTVNGPTLTLGHSFQTENLYYSSVYLEDELFVLDNTDKTIKVLDMTGKILRTMDNCPDWPRYLAVSPANRVLYVSNYLERTVKCMTIDGEVLTLFKDGNIGVSEQLAVHPDGSVYVCTLTSIHHITSQCTHIETILDHGELNTPMAICVNPSGDRLYATESNRSTEKVFILGD